MTGPDAVGVGLGVTEAVGVADAVGVAEADGLAVAVAAATFAPCFHTNLPLD